MNTRRVNLRAFTIIEVLTIVVILGVVAGMTLPRLLSGDSRVVARELQAVAGLLDAAATRESLSSAPVALEYKRGVLRLLVLRAPESFDAWSGYGAWVEDPLALPVALEHLTLTTASASGQVLARDEWRVDLSTIEVRPAVALGVSSADRAWVVYLEPDADHARILTIEQAEAASENANVVDLDLAGREEDPW